MNAQKPTNRLIILDRDGVINQDSANYIKTPEEWIPIPGSIEAIAKLYHHGFKIGIATNQSGIFRGFFSEATLQAMHHKLAQLLAKHNASITSIVFCPHGPDDGCDCRKPKPGLITQLLTQHQANPNKTLIPVVGDAIRDIQAAKLAHCMPYLVETGKGTKTWHEHPACVPSNHKFKNLMEFSEYWIAQHATQIAQWHKDNPINS